MMAVISVVVTAYNVEKYIEETVESVLAQSFSDFELIVINDGSTDHTEVLLNSLAKQNAQLNTITQKNAGVSAARNLGIREATGEYLLFLDGDDLLEKTALEKLYEVATTSQCDMVVGDFISFKESNGETKEIMCGDWDSLNGREYAKSLIAPEVNVTIWNKLVKRSLYTDNSITFPEYASMGEDYLTLVKLALAAKTVQKCNYPVVLYRIRANSLVTGLGKHHETIIPVIEELGEIVKQEFPANGEMWLNYLVVAYYHVFVYRVLSIHSYNSTHKKLYRWFKENIKHKLVMRIELLHLPRLERWVARLYWYSYHSAVILDFLVHRYRKIKNKKNNMR